MKMETEEMGSRRLDRVPMSGIRKVMNQVNALRAEGKDVISFSAGEPGFNTPEPIKEAACQCLRENLTHYPPNRGSLALRQAIARKTEEDTGVSYDPETEILITCGGAEGINDCILSTVDPGDEVIIFKPAFINYEALVLEIGAVPVSIDLRPENGFQIDLAEVESRITERTKLLVINSPNNPTGAVYSRDSLAGLGELAKKHHFLIFSDEMYSALVYDGLPFYSMAAFPGMKEQSLIVNGFSKTYAMTGWRLGYVTAPEKLMNRLVKHHQYTTTSIATFLQEGVALSMNLPETLHEVEHMKAMFARQRQVMMEGLDSLPGITYTKPYGAFYICADVSGVGMDGETFSRRLLDEALVATVPADCFGDSYQNLVRFSFAAKEEDIREGIRRIRAFLEASS